MSVSVGAPQCVFLMSPNLEVSFQCLSLCFIATDVCVGRCPSMCFQCTPQCVFSMSPNLGVCFQCLSMCLKVKCIVAFNAACHVDGSDWVFNVSKFLSFDVCVGRCPSMCFQCLKTLEYVFNVFPCVLKSSLL